MMARSFAVLCLVALIGSTIAATFTQSGTATTATFVTQSFALTSTLHNIHIDAKANSASTPLVVYARFGSAPTTSTYDFTASGTGSATIFLNEANLQTATLFISVRTTSGSDTVTITSNVDSSSVKATTTVSNAALPANTWAYYTFDVPEDRSNFKLRVFMLPRDNNDRDNKLEGVFVGNDGKLPTGTNCPQETDVLRRGDCDWLAADREGIQDRANRLDDSPPYVYGINALYQPKGTIKIGLRSSGKDVTYDLELSGVSKVVVAKAALLASALLAAFFAF